MRSAAMLAACCVALATNLLPASAVADASEVRLSRQYGIGYLPLMVMERRSLIEKQAQSMGLPVKVSWLTLSGGSATNDALLSGSLDYAGGGIGAFITLWERTRGGLEVKSPGALCSYPMYLNSNNPRVHSIRDLTDKDKIAVAAVKISPQAVTLQAAAAQAFGNASYAKLDALTVSLGHPEALQAVMSGASEINAHFATPPFQYEELKDTRVHTILNSNDVWGGALTANILWSTSKFAEQNPVLHKAVVAALEESTEWINGHKREAAELYIGMSKDKAGVEAILAMLNNPEIRFALTPENMMKFVDFKAQTGSLKAKPASWKDLFFPNVWSRPGS